MYHTAADNRNRNTDRQRQNDNQYKLRIAAEALTQNLNQHGKNRGYGKGADNRVYLKKQAYRYTGQRCMCQRIANHGIAAQHQEHTNHRTH